SLASKIGGIPSAIRNVKNGWTFSLDASPELYCDRIQDYLSSKTSYQELALSSFQEYSQRLNWRYAGNKVHDLIEEYCT
ncbi:MAG: group 1 glycosyl transferase, partial [Xenococcus sp. (in: cyanobacteria)]